MSGDPMPPLVVTAPSSRRFNAPLRRGLREAVPLVVAVPQPDITRPGADGAAVWVPADGSICVDGRYIRGGMVYVAATSDVKCAIQPDLSVGWDSPDFAGESMYYWPTYAGCRPEARAAYLSWLAAGRDNPDAYIGYVFLFYYGIEHRLLFDHDPVVASPETDSLLAEVQRLHDLHDDRSFRGYSGDLLNLFAAIKASNSDEPLPPVPPRDVPAGQLPVGVGRFLLEGSVPAEWAFEYLTHHDDYTAKTADRNCPEMLRDLFLVRFKQRWGDRIEMQPALGRDLVLRYKAAAVSTAGSFGDEVSIRLDHIPDPDATALFYELEPLARECAADLIPYSRNTVTRPGDTAEALAKLPPELLAVIGTPMLVSLREVTAAALNGADCAPVLWDDLVAVCSAGDGPPSPKHERANAKRVAAAVAALLGGIGVGLEPDVRLGPTIPNPGSTVMLFPLDDPAADLSSGYPAAMIAARLVAAVATADSALTDSEARILDTFAGSVLGVAAGDRLRLGAYLRWLAGTTTTMAGVRAAAAKLTSEQQTLLGDLLVAVAVCDGQIAPSEIAALTTAFDYAGLDTGEVYRRLHAVSAGEATPMTVRDAEPARRWAIPTEAAAGAAAAVLDRDRVRARIDDTARVEMLLAEIFADPPDESAGAPPQADVADDRCDPADDPAAPLVAGLDTEHAALAVAVARQENWPRAELQTVAASLGLPMLDGALAEINEAAAEVCGEPLIEGDDPLTVNPYAAEEML